MREREETLQRSMHEKEESLERELQASMERNAQREQEVTRMRELEQQQQQRQLTIPQSSEIFQNPFASHEPLDSQHREHIEIKSEEQEQVSSRTAHAILRHNLSSNHQENVNPFADTAALLESGSSSVRGQEDDETTEDAFADADDRSVTVGRDDHGEEEEDQDWTEAEIGSIGSHDSDESWVSQ